MEVQPGKMANAGGTHRNYFLRGFMEYERIPCKFCGHFFTPERKEQKFCCLQCVQLNKNKEVNDRWLLRDTSKPKKRKDDSKVRMSHLSTDKVKKCYRACRG